NNIVTTYLQGMNETATNADISPVSNLFASNTTDFRDENATNVNGANAINVGVAGASGNVSDPAGFVTGPSCRWTANGVDTAATFTTLLTDGLTIPGGTGNGLAGRYVNPDVTQSREFYVTASTNTTLTVLGDASAIALSGRTYRVDSLHLAN